MPRLLLVDDNPSIHKIAETLLGSSPIELYCVGSASEALMMLDSGERFDVALLDTAMPGMDGWELLSLMRKHPDSAYIPIAMMAGVLDTVDPEKLKHAPIQGFIKKPIELRELAERVQHLLATPVTLAENEGTQEGPTVLSPFATVPGTKIKSLPEFRGAVDGPPPEEIRPWENADFDEKDTMSLQGDQDDLLLLTPEDFWFEEAPVEPGSPDFLLAEATAQAMAEAQHEAPVSLAAPADATLDLEELDLEALKDLPAEEPPTLPEVPEIPVAAEAHGKEPEELFGEAAESPAPAIEPALPSEALSAIGDLHGREEDTLAIPGLAALAHTISSQEPVAADSQIRGFLTEEAHEHGLPELGEAPDFETMAPEVHHTEAPVPPEFEEAATPAEAHGEPAFPSAAAYAIPAAAAAAALPAFAAMHGAHDSAAAPVHSDLEPFTEPAIAIPAAIAPLASLAPPSPATAGVGGEAPRDAAALLQVLMSDPVLMDALAKAVVARLGDQALREIAWELMPELAEKLPR